MQVETMLDEERLREHLPVCGLGEALSFHQEVDSTNDVARDLAEAGAHHGTLIIANSQRRGRGQKGKSWITVPGAGLALSLILRPERMISNVWPTMHAISSLSVVYALEAMQLSPEIKWPNDILLNGKKVAGILLEVSWDGNRVDYFVVGIGINVKRNSIPVMADLQFPASSIEGVLGKRVDPYLIVELLLEGMGKHFLKLEQKALFESWEAKLAYLGDKVVLINSEEQILGKFLGLNHEGMAKVQVNDDEWITVGIGDYQMRAGNA
jgi:BirA family biotin operon repressor/biotin-[acetyl-CoA-carboxylase] ligase